MGEITRVTLNTKGHLPPVTANRELLKELFHFSKIRHSLLPKYRLADLMGHCAHISFEASFCYLLSVFLYLQVLKSNVMLVSCAGMHRCKTKLLLLLIVSQGSFNDAVKLLETTNHSLYPWFCLSVAILLKQEFKAHRFYLCKYEKVVSGYIN